jgi:hypothetical protein
MTSLSFGATKQPVECSFDAANGLLLIPLFRPMPSGADAQMIDSARQSGGSSVPSKLPEQIFFPVATPRPAYEAVIDRRRWTISFRAIALARRAQHEDPRTRNAKGRLIAILLTGGGRLRGRRTPDPEGKVREAYAGEEAYG